MMRMSVMGIVGLAVCTGAASAAEDSYTIDPSDAMFAVVTHKAGIASSLAHNHMIYPGSFKVEASSGGKETGKARFVLRFSAADLQVDNPTAKDEWYPRIHAVGIMDDPFPKVSDSNRKTIRKNMLDKSQLDAEASPEITAELVGIRAQNIKRGEKSFEYEPTVALTLRGKTVKKPFAANISIEGDVVHVEAVGTFHFTDFGITPYSAFFGAVRNEDAFYVYANFKAKRVVGASTGSQAGG